LKIDVHTHILPKRLPDLKERYGYGGFIRMDHVDSCTAHMMRDDGTFFRQVEDNLWDPSRRLEECDRAGVDLQVLSTVPVLFSYWTKPDHGHDLSRILNDHIAETVRKHPTRFAGLGTLPMQHPDLAARELHRCVEQLGLSGVEIGTHVGEWNLDEPALLPVFQEAESLGASVFVHPWDMMGKEAMPKYWLPWLVGMPAETSRAICSLVFGGVLERLPGLRILFAHGGGSFPGTIGRVAHGFQVRPDLCAVDNDRDPREYVKRIYVDSLVHDPRALRYLLDLFGADRVALGSVPDLEPGEKDQVLSRTPLEFLGRPVPEPAGPERP